MRGLRHTHEPQWDRAQGETKVDLLGLWRVPGWCLKSILNIVDTVRNIEYNYIHEANT
jgi:hypothetical protein